MTRKMFSLPVAISLVWIFVALFAELTLPTDIYPVLQDQVQQSLDEPWGYIGAVILMVRLAVLLCNPPRAER